MVDVGSETSGRSREGAPGGKGMAQERQRGRGQSRGGTRFNERVQRRQNHSGNGGRGSAAHRSGEATGCPWADPKVSG